MKTEKFKKSLSLLLAVIMLLTMMPAMGLIPEAEAAYPMMKAYISLPVNSLPDYHAYRDSIVTATFLDKIDTDNAVMQWDISADEADGTVKAWLEINEEETTAAGADMYDLYIAGDGGVAANTRASNVFYMFKNLKQINGLENFDTSGATTMDSFFEGCSSLKSVDLSSFDTSNVTNLNWLFTDCIMLESVNLANWDTSKVTTMMRMFMNCESLRTLDASSFDTRKVTNMERMFYRCMALENIYIGDYWTVEKVSSDNAMFNCCYAIVGGKENYDRDFQYFPPRKEYAKLREEGGFLDRKPEAVQYRVTYKFVGDIIPDGVTAPDAATYEEGTTVTVAGDSSAEHYIFSGWTTEDAVVAADGNFIINNDVEFVGLWTKLYKVEYRYDEAYAVPDEAPRIPDTELWFEPGADVPLYGVPYVPEYVFVGWNTEDAEVVGDSFTMPEKDVVLYGFYKKPVESVEIIGDKEITLDKDDEDGEKINVFVKPEDATIKEIVYETSDDKVAIVENGVIKPVGEGTATITVASKDDPTKSDTITVTVKTFVKDIEVDKTEINLNKNDTDKITATVTPDGATNKEVIFSSDDDKVVTVDQDGNIKAVGDGNATITVTSKDNPEIKKEITVTVKTPVTEITSKEDLVIYKDTEENLDAKVNEDATNKELIYESGNPGIVKVDSEGNVVGVGAGTTTVTVISKDNPEIKKEITVTVKIPVEDIIVNKDEFTLEVDEREKIEVTVKPDNATDKGVIYTSGNEDVVKVDENGNITAAGEGTATITITSKDDPNITETVTVTVIKNYKVTYSFIGEVIPENVTAPEMKQYLNGSEVRVEDDAAARDYIFSGWSTDDAVVENGKFIITKDVHFVGSWEKINYYNVTYKYEGAVPDNAPEAPEGKTYQEGTEVTVADVPGLEGYTFSGWETKDVNVQGGKFIIDSDVEFVGKWEKKIISVDGITVDKTEITLTEGENDKITVTVTPENADNKKVTYESSDETVVRIDENGNIKAIGEGTATITVKTEDGGKQVTVTVNVKKPFIPVDKIEVEKDEFTLTEGETDKITVTVTPDNATDKKVTFESDDETVVKVDENGNIEAIGEGTATITVKTEDGGKQVTVTVNVKKPFIPVDKIEVEKDEFTLTEGETDKINVTVTPDNATDKKVTFESDDETVVRVDENGNIEAIGEGTATITVKTEDGGKQVTVTVKVEKKEEPEEPEIPDEPEEPEYVIEVPSEIKLVPGITELLNIKISPDDGKVKPSFSSADEAIARVDEFGNVTGVAAGETTIYIDFGNGDIRAVAVIVVAPAIPSIPRIHHVCFGKTDGIGWYEVSVNGGDFFPQGPNSTLEVEHGSILVVRVQDMWIDDEFDFYVNGNKVPLDPGNTITVYVDGYKLIGALSMDVEVPDVDESLTLLQKIVKAFKDFFAWIASWFK